VHEQQFPGITASQQQDGGGWSRRDRGLGQVQARGELWRQCDATDFTSLAFLLVDFGIEGKVALVTGSTKGIGLAIAQALAREGASVSVVARTESDVKRVAESIGGFGVASDVLTEDGCRRAVDETVSRLGPIDILVNNFGSRAGNNWSDSGPQEFERAFAGNVGVSLRFTQRVLPGMLERGWGRVVVISSVWGREWGGAPAYNAAKAAENSMVKSLAREVAAKGVTVNAVAPGSILWEGGGWFRRQQADPEGIAEFVRHEMPMGRFGSVDEVANVVAFVCSQQASLLTGACINVDGGQSRSII
jgi:3-oxoacyl-[acyl-carrier protein] reductase